MIRNTGDSEDHQSYRTDKRIREMQSHLYTAGSTTHRLPCSRCFYGYKHWRLREGLNCRYGGYCRYVDTADMEDTTDTVEVADTVETRDQGQICRELGWRLA